MNLAMFANFPGAHEWRLIQPAVVYYLLYSFYPCQHTGDLIQEHLGQGNELALPDGTKLRFLTCE